MKAILWATRWINQSRRRRSPVRGLGFALLALIPLALAIAAAAATPGSISTVAGTGTVGFSGDGGPATAAQLYGPGGLALTADGGYLIADQLNNRVRKLSASGTITTVAGTGANGFSGDGGPATAAQLSNPTDVAATADGGFLIADQTNGRIRSVSPSGIISTVAGTGSAGTSGDGGPATSAKFLLPTGVAPTADGGFLVADDSGNNIRKVSSGGIISTVAGSSAGTSGSSGDGGPATAALLHFPRDAASTADGGFLIADSGNNRIRKVSAGGSISTVAGNGTAGFAGDGGAATSAQLSTPRGIAPTADGGFLIADSLNGRVRSVSAAGTITTVAGGGANDPGNGGAATAAMLGVGAVAPTGDGGFLIAEGDRGSRVFRVEAGTFPSQAPVVTITGKPAAETQQQRATFTFTGPAGGTFACSIDSGPFKACSSGVTFEGLAPGDHRFRVHETLGGVTGPDASYSWTVLLPKPCVLRTARARVLVYTTKNKVRLVIRYTSYKPATVTVSYKVAGSKGKLALGKASARFTKQGVFKLAKGLNASDAAKVRAAKRFSVHFKIPATPTSCKRYYSKRLTIPRKTPGKTVFFQSDSVFAPGS